jgi:threonylcarbamoyladenosine tRNA methylthiotransferase MtaB
MKKAAIATLGCKVNQVESGSIAGQLKNRNFEIVDFDQSADIYIINTCTVTNRTDFKSRSLIRRALKAKETNPLVKIIVTGCYAQKERDEIKVLGGIDLIVDNQNKVDLDKWLDNSGYSFEDIRQAEKMIWKPIDCMHERTRAFLKIQDGCDYYCSYCAVPYGRGSPRSLDFARVVSQAEQLVDNGYKEIILTGINLGLYKDNNEQKELPDVINALVKIDKLILLRLSSIEPDLWTEKLLTAIASSSKICPHFHIPLQSGSDDVLTRMKRKYKAGSVKSLVKNLVKASPFCAIGLDIICGFPNETEVEFSQTSDFISDLPIAYLHVFGYSKRSRTPAAVMNGQVHGKITRCRVSSLMELGKLKKVNYINLLIDSKTVLNGVIENKVNQSCTALSDHYVRIYSKSERLSENDVMSGTPISAYKEGIII